MKRCIIGLLVIGLLFSGLMSLNKFSIAQTKIIPKEYHEAPMLAELVKQGKLPPVKERLPEEPLVYVEGIELPKGDIKLEIGKYGGVLRIVNQGSPGGGEWWSINREPLLIMPGLGQPGMKPYGNVFKDFDMSKDAKTFTFYLRKGMKWSDGEPVTTEDVRFAFEDVLLNKELTPKLPERISNLDGTPPKLDIVDKYTFKLTFKESYGLFPYILSNHWDTYDSIPLLVPSHYMKKFHIKYTPLEKLQPLLKKQGLGEKEWARLYSLYSYGGWGIGDTKLGCPTLAPYVLDSMPSAQVAILKRNPYYWKVDAAGNQLPYIDEIRADTVARVDMIPMKIVAGEVDLARQVVSAKELSFYKENESKGGYRAVLLKEHQPLSIFFNYTHPDPVWRKIVLNRKFREALSLAIDRDEIIDTVYTGFASHSKIATTEYNPDKARQILDSIGLDKRDAEGWRLRPDGKRLEIIIQTSELSDEWMSATPIVVDNWKKVGIYTTMKADPDALLHERARRNETQVRIIGFFDLYAMEGNPASIELYLLRDAWATPIGFLDWYREKGKKGVEPPAAFKPIFTIYQKMRTAKSFNEIKGYLESWKKALNDSMFVIIPVEDLGIPLIVSNKLGNVPEKGYQIVANFAGEILYYK